MKPDLTNSFIVDLPSFRITVRREFDAPRQLVWDCHTKAELLDQWFAPKPLTARTKSMDFREGGHWHYAMIDPSGQEYWSRMEYQTIRPTTNYTLRDGFSDATGALAPGMPTAIWHVTFTDRSERTLVETVVAYDSQEALQQVIDMGMQEGLTSTLERLDELLPLLRE